MRFEKECSAPPYTPGRPMGGLVLPEKSCNPQPNTRTQKASTLISSTLNLNRQMQALEPYAPTPQNPMLPECPQNVPEALSFIIYESPNRKLDIPILSAPDPLKLPIKPHQSDPEMEFSERKAAPTIDFFPHNPWFLKPHHTISHRTLKPYLKPGTRQSESKP